RSPSCACRSRFPGRAARLRPWTDHCLPATGASGSRPSPGVRILVVTDGDGPGRSPLLLLHGHPQTHAIWHRVAPASAQIHTLVLPDLRGYGDSSKPAGGERNRLGHRSFAVLAYDRGARVAHRMAADHPDAVSRMALLDIAPTLAMYEQTTEAFARAYWHWFFLIQPAPLPERLIEADPGGYLNFVMRRRTGRDPFDPRAFAEY